MDLHNIPSTTFKVQSAYHGILFFTCYFRLKHTKNKEVWQKEAYRLVTCYIRFMLLIMFFFCVFAVWTVIVMLGPALSGGEPYPGHVRNGQIEYINNEEHYLSLDVFGTEAEAGDSVTVYTSKDGTPIDCESSTEASLRVIEFIAGLLALIVYLSFSCVTLQRFICKHPYYESFVRFVDGYQSTRIL